MATEQVRRAGSSLWRDGDAGWNEADERELRGMWARRRLCLAEKLKEVGGFIGERKTGYHQPRGVVDKEAEKRGRRANKIESENMVRDYELVYADGEGRAEKAGLKFTRSKDHQREAAFRVKGVCEDLERLVYKMRVLAMDEEDAEFEAELCGAVEKVYRLLSGEKGKSMRRDELPGFVVKLAELCREDRRLVEVKMEEVASELMAKNLARLWVEHERERLDSGYNRGTGLTEEEEMQLQYGVSGASFGSEVLVGGVASTSVQAVVEAVDEETSAVAEVTGVVNEVVGQAEMLVELADAVAQTGTVEARAEVQCEEKRAKVPGERKTGRKVIVGVNGETGREEEVYVQVWQVKTRRQIVVDGKIEDEVKEEFVCEGKGVRCGKVYKKWGNAVNHVMKVHLERGLKCRWCRRQFLEEGARNRHEWLCGRKKVEKEERMAEAERERMRAVAAKRRYGSGYAGEEAEGDGPSSKRRREREQVAEGGVTRLRRSRRLATKRAMV